MAVRQLNDGRWVCYYVKNGKRVDEYFGRGKQGEDAAHARNHEIKALKRRKQDIDSGRQKISLGDLVQNYLDHLKTQNASEKYRKEIAQLWMNHLLPLLGKIPPDRLTESDITSVIDYYKKRGTSQHTINRYLRYIRTVIRYGVNRGLIEHNPRNPLHYWQQPKEKARHFKLTVEGLEKLIEHAEPHLSWALQVLFNLGCRPGTSELTALKWEHVDYKNNLVYVWGNKTQEWREIPVSNDFLQRLYLKQGEAKTDYIIEYNGQPVRKFRRSVKTAARRAGLHESLCLYEVRHLFATTILNGGADLAAVSKLLGHASTQMTADQYYHLMEGEKAKAVGLLPQLGRKKEDAESDSENEAEGEAGKEEEEAEKAATNGGGNVISMFNYVKSQGR